MCRPLAAAPLAAAPLAVTLLAACGGGDKPTEPPKPTLVSIAIDQKFDTLSELTTRQLSVAGVDSKGAPAAVAGTVAWSSSDTSVVVIDASGVVAGVQPGSATVTARTGTLSASLPVRVVGVPVRDVTIRLVGALAADTLMVGTSATLVAEARDVNGRLLRGRAIDLAVSDSTRATLDGAGKLTGRAVGYLTIVAHHDSVVRRPVLVVRPTFAARIALRLADPKKLGDTTWAGLRDSALVSFADSAGQPLPPSPFRPVSYATDDAKVATVDATGRVALVGTGTATIRASGERLVAATSVVVVRGPIVGILAAPDTVRVLPGEVTTIRPIFVDGGGLRVTALGATPVAYAAQTPALATVDAAGNVRGVKAGVGSVRITAARGTVSVPVRVLSPAGANAFTITVRFVGPPPSQEVLDAFAAAKTRWENVIRESTGTDTVDLPRAACGTSDSAHTEIVKDVLILARIDSIDGPSNILGSANWCVRKQMPNGHWLPMLGRMQFDSADMKLMATTGRLGNVIAHEMGHVLGIGTLWSAAYHRGVALAQQGGFDPSYFGAGGIAASAGMGFTGFSIAAASGLPVLDRVPLEDTGGPGTAGTHWRRSVFGNELMNGFAGSGLQPLSLLTVSAISDLGYVVSTSAAEAWGTYILGGPASTLLSRYVGVPSGPAMQLRETFPEPEGYVDLGGRFRPLRAPTPR